ncbi:MAG: hypothetical protein FJ276_16105 [Planctomycetes bacterium]|nr:hypothetical protein [Planctomycetota bacterium]
MYLVLLIQQSAISNQQSAISNQQSAISNQQSAISNQRLIRPSRSRAWLRCGIHIGGRAVDSVVRRERSHGFRQRFAVRLDFSNGVDNVVHVGARSEEH